MYGIDTEEGMDRAKVWMTAILSLIKPGGQWIIPRSGATYTFFHDTKTAYRAAYLADSAADRVLRALGWTVTDPHH